MKHACLLLLLLASLARPALAMEKPVEKEYVVLTGGVSLYAWEKFKAQPHDHWWANFVHASRVRFAQMRAQYGPTARITWLVYEEGYKRRSEQENKDLIADIKSVRDAFGLNLILFNKSQEIIDYLNFGQPRDQVKIADFEYFGHSNRACWMLDYSNEMDSASKCWLHENDFAKIKRGIFTKDVFVKSWGCHSGEEMSRYWHSATGTRMWGAIGRTDYSNDDAVVISTPGGKWVD